MWNIIIGLIFLVGGLSGQLAIKGTDSTVGAAVLGGGLMVFGLFQVVRGRNTSG